MSQLPADQAIQRFKENEERVDLFVNDLVGYNSTGGLPVESLPSFIRRIDFKLLGPFAAGTAYALNNVVTYAGLAYLCVSAYTSNSTTPDADTTHWSLWPGVTAAALAGIAGASLLGYQSDRGGAIAQDVERKLNNMPCIDDIIPDGAPEHSAYFQQVMTNGGYWRIGPGPYTFSSSAEVSGTANTKLFFEGTVINHATTNKKTFKWINVDDWAMLGQLTIVGAGKASGTAVGVYREGCNRFEVHNVKAKNISGHGFYEAPGTHVAPRGDQGSWYNCRSYNCWIGRQDVADSGAEYNTWVGYTASGCGIGNITAAGNNLFLGGKVVDNDNGVWVQGGSNHAHGSFVGVDINHNTTWNIRLSDVTNGETFVGCHCYGDSTSLGIIWLERSKGFSFVSGILDASIACDEAVGYNLVANNYCPDSGNANVHGGSTPKKVIYRNNFAPTGMWKLNDPGTCFVRASRAGNQSITAGSQATILYNSVFYDTRDAYDETTGVFTFPWLGNFDVSGCVRVLGTTVNPDSANQNGYVAILLNGAAIGFAPLVKYGTDGAVASFAVATGAAAGAVLQIQVVGRGTDLVVSDLGTTLSIKEIS